MDSGYRLPSKGRIKQSSKGGNVATLPDGLVRCVFIHLAVTNLMKVIARKNKEDGLQKPDKTQYPADLGGPAKGKRRTTLIVCFGNCVTPNGTAHSSLATAAHWSKRKHEKEEHRKRRHC